ncbi:T9SS type A sorting domain-containing protein [Taibaiella helva]|uniref:T9SS type A sorting domain-containing protein n=1 Tax=Taibaiella helva TaxID=2301235 RepID=UPI000E580DC4|nr:T9SS type A sorting domain-containing protein [Taibaiella helva]
MKRILTTLVLSGALVTSSYAQVDLGVTILSPTSGQSFPNTLDSIRFSFKITNNSTTALSAADGDTIMLFYDVRMFGVELPTQYYVSEKIGATLAAGASLSFNLALAPGEQFWNNPSNPKVAIPKDAKVCPYVGFFALTTSDGETRYYNDPGVDAQAIEAAFGATGTTPNQMFASIIAALSGNNFAKVDNVKFGSGATDKCSVTNNPTGILELNGNHAAMTVYPNPATGNINLDFSSDKASNKAVVRITDISGRTVALKELGAMPSGVHKVSVDVSSLRAGMYLIELNAGHQRATGKFTVAK